MKRIVFAVVAVAMLSLAASATTNSYNFYFQAVNGDPYCDGMILYLYGNPQTLVDGTHFNVYCYPELITGVNGFKAPVASSYQYAGSGPVLIVDDPPAFFEDGGETAKPNQTQNFNSQGAMYLINTKTHTWTIWLSGFGTGEYVDNFGIYSDAQNQKPLAKGTKSSRTR